MSSQERWRCAAVLRDRWEDAPVRLADALVDDLCAACRRLEALLEATPAVTRLLDADDVSPITWFLWKKSKLRVIIFAGNISLTDQLRTYPLNPVYGFYAGRANRLLSVNERVRVLLANVPRTSMNSNHNVWFYYGVTHKSESIAEYRKESCLTTFSFHRLSSSINKRNNKCIF